MSPSITTLAADRVAAAVQGWTPQGVDAAQLYDVLRFLGRWRSHMLANTYIAHHGAKIWGGPFAGM